MKLNKTRYSLILGLTAGLINLIPMILEKLGWEIVLSTLVMWVIIGYLLAHLSLPWKGVRKGVILAFLVFLPMAIVISRYDPLSLITISAMTFILGGLLGSFITMYETENKEGPSCRSTF
jgi:hypothetical protein